MTPEEVMEAINQVLPGFRGKNKKYNKADIYRACIEKGVVHSKQLAPTTYYRFVREYGLLNDDIDNNPVFSIKIAKEFTGDNEELAYELFDMLRAELDSYKEAILLAVENNDLDKLRETVHKIHGASRCCGTTELKQSSSHIETLITQNINFDIEKETAVLLDAIKNVADYRINKNT